MTAASSPAPTCLPQTATCLLTRLQPIRHCLHPFLGAVDAVQLMSTSRASTALLSDYAFVDHVFSYNEHSVADCKRSIAFYSHYHMHSLRMCLPPCWNEPLVDSCSGRSHLPSSLVALALGSSTRTTERFDGTDSRSQRWSEKDKVDKDGLDEFYRLIRPVGIHSRSVWDVTRYGSCEGQFNQPIPPGALSTALRYLQINSHFNQPLQLGSIPDTVEVLHFGNAFNHPLEIGHLPASLTHLVFDDNYNQPLLPGVLPASLRRLDLGYLFNQPIPLHTLPPHLQQLSLGVKYSQPILPGAIPSRHSSANQHLLPSFTAARQHTSRRHSPPPRRLLQPAAAAWLSSYLVTRACHQSPPHPAVAARQSARRTGDARILHISREQPKISQLPAHPAAWRHTCQRDSSQYGFELQGATGGRRHTSHSEVGAAAAHAHCEGCERRAVTLYQSCAVAMSVAGREPCKIGGSLPH